MIEGQPRGRGVATILLVMLVAVTAVPGADATTLLYVDLERMSREAPMVVHGHVAWDYAVQKEAPGDIWSYTGVEVATCVEGECPETVVLQHRGGTVGDLTLHIPGMPRFQPGQEVLLFLRPAPGGEEGMLSVFGMAQGHFVVVEDENGKKTAVQQLGKVTLASQGQAGAIVPLAVAPIVEELSILIQRIRTLAAQGGGQ